MTTGSHKSVQPLGVGLAALLLTSSNGLAATSELAFEVRTGAAQHSLQHAAGQPLHDVTREHALTLSVEGPATLSLAVYPHAQRARAEARIVILRNGQRIESLALVCNPGVEQFAESNAPELCAPLEHRIDVPAGAHEIVLRMVGAGAASVLPRLDRAAQAIAELELAPIVATPAGAGAQAANATQPAKPAPALSTSFWQRLPSRPTVWAPAAGSVLAWGVATYFGLSSRSAFDTAAGNVTQLRRKRLNEAGQRDAYVANVLIGVGALSMAAAVFAALDPLGHDGAQP